MNQCNEPIQKMKQRDEERQPYEVQKRKVKYRDSNIAKLYKSNSTPKLFRILDSPISFSPTMYILARSFYIYTYIIQ